MGSASGTVPTREASFMTADDSHGAFGVDSAVEVLGAATSAPLSGTDAKGRRAVTGLAPGGM